MPRIALIPPSEAGAELRRAYARMREGMGVRGAPPFSPRIMQCFSHRPHLVVAAAEGYHFAGWGGKLPRATRELVALLVSRENDCFY
jgi:alkylhydroperoxidase family enzyme